MAAKKKAAKKTAAKGGAKKKVVAKRARRSETGGESEPAQAGGAGTAGTKVSSIGVNRGHLFALRPRVDTAFPPGDFDTAKHFLRDESYASIEEAARAVAEKALELTHQGSSRLGKVRH
jgi:hypothetical protein